MGATISKEVYIELEYREIREAVSDLNSREQLELVNDCELLNQESVIDYIENCSEGDIQEIVQRCNLVSDDLIENYISEMSTDQVKDLITDTQHRVLFENNLSEQDQKLLDVCKKYLTDEQIKTIIEKHEDIASVVKVVFSLVK